MLYNCVHVIWAWGEDNFSRLHLKQITRIAQRNNRFLQKLQQAVPERSRSCASLAITNLKAYT